MILRSGAQAVEVFLYAADERIEILRGTYCGGEEGHKQYEGNYKLFSVTNNLVISSLDSGDLTFTEGRIEGLQIFRVPKRTEPLIAVYQYQGCNGDRVELFRVDDRGRLFRAYFQNKDGSKDVAIGHGFGAPEPPTSPLGFCHYNNAVGTFCDEYIFDGQNFVQSQSYLYQGEGDKHPSVSQARRALFDFLSALKSGAFERAAFYFAGVIGAFKQNQADVSVKDVAAF